MTGSYYDVLGINIFATKQDIKKAYKALAMKLHPDRTQNNKKLEEQFKAVKKAYEILSNSEKRSRYDSVLNRQQNTSQSPESKDQSFYESDVRTFRGTYHCDAELLRTGGKIIIRVDDQKYRIHIPPNTTNGQKHIFGVDNELDIEITFKEKAKPKVKEERIHIFCTAELIKNGGVHPVFVDGVKYRIRIPANSYIGETLSFDVNQYHIVDVVINLKKEPKRQSSSHSSHYSYDDHDHDYYYEYNKQKQAPNQNNKQTSKQKERKANSDHSDSLFKEYQRKVKQQKDLIEKNKKEQEAFLIKVFCGCFLFFLFVFSFLFL